MVVVYLLFVISASGWLGANYCVCYVINNCNKTLQVLTVSWTSRKGAANLLTVSCGRIKAWSDHTPSLRFFQHAEFRGGSYALPDLTKWAVLPAAAWKLRSQSLRKVEVEQSKLFAESVELDQEESDCQEIWLLVQSCLSTSKGGGRRRAYPLLNLNT
jgi:hypothetical protein